MLLALLRPASFAYMLLDSHFLVYGLSATITTSCEQVHVHVGVVLGKSSFMSLCDKSIQPHHHLSSEKHRNSSVSLTNYFDDIEHFAQMPFKISQQAIPTVNGCSVSSSFILDTSPCLLQLNIMRWHSVTSFNLFQAGLICGP